MNKYNKFRKDELIGGMFSPHQISIYDAQNNLNDVKIAYERITKANKDLSFIDICKILKLNQTERNHLNTFIKCDFDYSKISKELVVTPNLFKKDYLYVKINRFRRVATEHKYGKLLVPISFDTNSSMSKESSTRTYKVGTVVKFSYYRSIADLYIFYFDTHLFPLRRDEFEWVDDKK